jgi:phosphoglycolate phosphatase-like HAD superfamily hydrolase
MIIGDRASDVEAGRAAGIDAALFAGSDLVQSLRAALAQTSWASARA